LAAYPIARSHGLASGDPAALDWALQKAEENDMNTDLRGFTALAERLDPEQVVTLLNSYFEPCWR